MASSEIKTKAAEETVLVTGASSGLGTYLAHAFARAGYSVILHGRDEKKLAAARDEILKNEQVECMTIAADLRDANGVDAIVKVLRNENVGVLVNNAAVNPELSGRTALTDWKDIDAVIATNATSAIALCYAAFDHFKTRGGGMIININTVAGLRGSSHEALYAASKFGLRGFSESVKEDWLKQGTRMIDVYSGAMGTGMSAGRPDVHDLIDPKELAEFLIGLCATKSFFIKELNVRRTAV